MAAHPNRDSPSSARR